jgi:hypothetical protein
MKASKVRDIVGSAVIGVVLGYCLSRIGFSSWDRVHEMFTFADLRLFLTFLTGVGTLAVAWLVVKKLSSPNWDPRPIHPGTVAGGAVFGLGWALSGACPAIAFVQLGERQLGALWTLGGIVLGNFLYSLVHERWFRWSPGSCGEG